MDAFLDSLEENISAGDATRQREVMVYHAVSIQMFNKLLRGEMTDEEVLTNLRVARYLDAKRNSEVVEQEMENAKTVLKKLMEYRKNDPARFEVPQLVVPPLRNASSVINHRAVSASCERNTTSPNVLQTQYDIINKLCFVSEARSDDCKTKSEGESATASIPRVGSENLDPSTITVKEDVLAQSHIFCSPYVNAEWNSKVGAAYCEGKITVEEQTKLALNVNARGRVTPLETLNMKKECSTKALNSITSPQIASEETRFLDRTSYENYSLKEPDLSPASNILLKTSADSRVAVCSESSASEQCLASTPSDYSSSTTLFKCEVPKDSEVDIASTCHILLKELVSSVSTTCETTASTSWFTFDQNDNSELPSYSIADPSVSEENMNEVNNVEFDGTSIDKTDKTQMASTPSMVSGSSKTVAAEAAKKGFAYEICLTPVSTISSKLSVTPATEIDNEISLSNLSGAPELNLTSESCATLAPKTRKRPRIESKSLEDENSSSNERVEIMQLYEKIYNMPLSSHFINPVKAQGYEQVVKKPVCLKEIKKKVVKGEITSISKFKFELLKMFANARMYNSSHTQFCRDTKAMYAEVQELFKKARCNSSLRERCKSRKLQKA